MSLTDRDVCLSPVSKDGGERFYSITSGGIEVGKVQVIENCSSVFISYISIFPQYRREGYATASVDAIRDAFCNKDVFLCVGEGAAAKSFWDAYLNSRGGYVNPTKPRAIRLPSVQTKDCEYEL